MGDHKTLTIGIMEGTIQAGPKCIIRQSKHASEAEDWYTIQRKLSKVTFTDNQMLDKKIKDTFNNADQPIHIKMATEDKPAKKDLESQVLFLRPGSWIWNVIANYWGLQSCKPMTLSQYVC